MLNDCVVGDLTSGWFVVGGATDNSKIERR